MSKLFYSDFTNIMRHWHQSSIHKILGTNLTNSTFWSLAKSNGKMFETVVQICQHFTKIGNAWKKTHSKTVYNVVFLYVVVCIDCDLVLLYLRVFELIVTYLQHE